MKRLNRRRFLASSSIAALGSALLPDSAQAAELRIQDAYSPRNSKRAQRPRTDYIILHTTEAGDKGSFNSVFRYGSCHYLIHTNGLVRRIIHRDKIANHAGRSLWNGMTNLSMCSLGIEIVGTYQEAPRDEQLVALKQVLAQLQDIYDIPDKNVLTHSQVAYAYHSGEGRRLRGRKKDAVMLADPEVRALVGLTDRWTYDPDERAGRVAFQDYPEGRWLKEVLYKPGPATTASAVLASVATGSAPAPQDPESEPEAADVAFDVTGDVTGEDDPEILDGLLEVGVHGHTVGELAGGETYSPTTIYFLPDGRMRPGDHLRGSPLLEHPPEGLKLLVGYVIGGEVTARTHAVDIAGDSWNYPSTFYRLPNHSIRRGDQIDESAIPPGTLVLYRR